MLSADVVGVRLERNSLELCIIALCIEGLADLTPVAQNGMLARSVCHLAASAAFEKLTYLRRNA